MSQKTLTLFLRLPALLLLVFLTSTASAQTANEDAVASCTKNISSNFDFSIADAHAWCEFDSSAEFQSCAQNLRSRYHLNSWNAVLYCGSNNMQEIQECAAKKLGQTKWWQNGAGYYAVVESGAKYYDPNSQAVHTRHRGENTHQCSPYRP